MHMLARECARMRTYTITMPIKKKETKQNKPPWLSKQLASQHSMLSWAMSRMIPRVHISTQLNQCWWPQYRLNYYTWMRTCPARQSVTASNHICMDLGTQASHMSWDWGKHLEICMMGYPSCFMRMMGYPSCFTHILASPAINSIAHPKRLCQRKWQLQLFQLSVNPACNPPKPDPYSGCPQNYYKNSLRKTRSLAQSFLLTFIPLW